MQLTHDALTVMSRSGSYKDLCPASTDPATVKEAMLSLASYFFKLDIAGKTTWDTSHHIKGEKAYALHKLEEHRRITLENAKEFVTGFLREAPPSSLTQYYYRECAKNEIASEHCHVTDAPKDSEHTDPLCDINGFISLIYHITVPSGRYHFTMGFDPTLPLPHGQPPSFDICAPTANPLLQDLPDPPLVASFQRNSRQDTTYPDISLSHARAHSLSRSRSLSLSRSLSFFRSLARKNAGRRSGPHTHTLKQVVYLLVYFD